MKKTDVLVIGGSAAGVITALAGKNSWPDKSFMLVKKQADVMVPCGIPFIFGTLDDSTQNIMPVDSMMAKNGVESLVDEIINIDAEEKKVSLASGDNIQYEKLVIATGSLPVMPA